MGFPVDPLALPWLLPFAGLPLLFYKRPRLSDEPHVTGPLVSVIVPARNESATIDRLLTSLRRTTYTPLEIIVVDDRSTDDTATLAQRHATEDSRVRLVGGEPLPEGWYGKPWACTQGARQARGGILLFTDADTAHEPALIAHAVGGLERSGADLLTVLTRQELGSFWERVVMPQILTLLLVRYSPARLNRAKRRRDVIANGQFIMVRREGYEAIGTHEQVRDAVAEDLAIAQRFVAAGRTLRAYWAEDLISTRMYTGLGQMVEGWSKNIYLGARATLPDEPALRALVPLLLAAGPLFWLLPLAALALGAGWAAAAIGFSVAFWTIVVVSLQLPPMYGLAYPLGAVVVLGMVARSTVRGGKRVVWRGREYSQVEGSRRRSKAVEEADG